MADDEAVEAAPDAPPIGLRIAVAVPVAVVASWLLLMYAFHLLWFSPEILDPGQCTPSDLREMGKGACGPEHGRVLWVGTCLAFVAGAICLIVTWARTPRPGRWWPWPTATMLIVIGWFVVQQKWLF